MRNRPLLATEPRASTMLTPGIQLALRFLQIPTLELQDLLHQELAANPLLELVEEGEEAAAEEEPAGGAAEETEEEPGPPEWAEPADPPEEARLPRGMRETNEGPDLVAALQRGASLADSLLAQLRLATSDPGQRRAAEYLIGSLDDRGYLACPVAQAARDLRLPAAAVRGALSLLQSFEPAGIAARDLRECLCLQLRARGREGSLAWRICREQFSRLGLHRHAEMAGALGVSPEELQGALQEIRRLRPHPGRTVSPEEVQYLYPDLIVERVEGGYEVFANDRVVPRLQVSRANRELLARPGADEEARRFALSHLRSARWILRALERRRSTMLRVMQCILEEQREFFDQGVGRLKPMTLQDVAGRLGLHESTIARVTRWKHVQTPRGIFPLKFFFSGRLRTLSGEAASARAVRERIRCLIEEEGDRPVTDEAMAAILEGEGIRIARRTVAKYRESLRIESARLRRRYRGGALAGDPAPRRSP
jgi:RNA polymerase sigma-54 factor